jgi:hypothetical protein
MNQEELWAALGRLVSAVVANDSQLAADHQDAILRAYVAATADEQRTMRVTLSAAEVSIGQLSDELRSPRI